jgi:hypothetical protein
MLFGSNRDDDDLWNAGSAVPAGGAGDVSHFTRHARRSGHAALSAISMTLLWVTGYSYFPIQNAYPNSFGRVAIFTLNYACVSALIVLTCGKLLKSLSASVDGQRLVAEALANRQAALHA